MWKTPSCYPVKCYTPMDSVLACIFTSFCPLPKVGNQRLQRPEGVEHVALFRGHLQGALRFRGGRLQYREPAQRVHMLLRLGFLMGNDLLPLLAAAIGGLFHGGTGVGRRAGHASGLLDTVTWESITSRALVTLWGRGALHSPSYRILQYVAAQTCRAASPP